MTNYYTSNYISNLITSNLITSNLITPNTGFYTRSMFPLFEDSTEHRRRWRRYETKHKELTKSSYDSCHKAVSSKVRISATKNK